MTSGYKHIRLFATQHLGTVLKNERGESSDWGIRLLYTQVYRRRFLCPFWSHSALLSVVDVVMTGFLSH